MYRIRFNICIRGFMFFKFLDSSDFAPSYDFLIMNFPFLTVRVYGSESVFKPSASISVPGGPQPRVANRNQISVFAPDAIEEMVWGFDESTSEHGIYHSPPCEAGESEQEVVSEEPAQDAYGIGTVANITSAPQHDLAICVDLEFRPSFSKCCFFAFRVDDHVVHSEGNVNILLFV